jgi:hypothetical protein
LANSDVVIALLTPNFYASAFERDLLRNSDGEIDVNEDHPMIRPAIAALSKLERFVEKASLEFHEAYERKYRDVLSFTNRGFWERHVWDPTRAASP